MSVDNNISVTANVSDPTLKKTISVLANGGKVVNGSSGVTGVKGSAESTYRTGNVSISPQNLGFEFITLTGGASGSITDAQLQILNSNVCNGIVYSGSVFKLSEKPDSGVWKYTAEYLTDIDKLQVIVINSTLKTYEYTLMSSAFASHIADTNVHIQNGERSIWNQITNVQLSNLSPELVATIKQWIAEGGGKEQQIVFATHSQFPSVGLVNKLYVAKDEHTIYLWDNTSYTYVIITTDYSDIKTIDGGGAAEE